MIAAGIDLGGTKIEAQVFAPDWTTSHIRRIETPRDYPALVAAVADQIDWATQIAGSPVPIGIAAAGVINPASDLALAANLPITGQPFPTDIAAAAGRKITFVNDACALVLSEAHFGAARGMSPALGIILGTGIGGGVAVDGRLLLGHSLGGPEFGHVSLSAHLLQKYDLPVLECGCGRVGCVETCLSGPGLSRLAQMLTGGNPSAQEIVVSKGSDPALAQVWDIWCELAADFIMTLVLTIDPEVVVLGGGLSRIVGVEDDLTRALARAQFPGFRIPAIRLAQGGDASGARGAAHAAWQATGQEANNG